jgi:pimeloyl-ACP methyl ester carboxylesterase
MITLQRIAIVLLTALIPSIDWAEAPTAEPRPGVVFVVGGVGGVDPLQRWAEVALPLAGVPHEIRVFEWTHGKFHMLRDLQDTRYLQEKAAELADQVRAVHADDPSRPVFLMGHSAGAALVLATAAQLPPASVERIILLSAAVSPTYELRPALRATHGEIVAFHSPLDVFMLHFGTGMFGTTDRYYENAAGLVGFQIPDDLDAEGRRLYGRLVQSGWKPEMWLERRCWHNSTCMPLFLGRQVTPWLLRPPEGGAPSAVSNRN